MRKDARALAMAAAVVFAGAPAWAEAEAGAAGTGSVNRVLDERKHHAVTPMNIGSQGLRADTVEYLETRFAEIDGWWSGLEGRVNQMDDETRSSYRQYEASMNERLRQAREDLNKLKQSGRAEADQTRAEAERSMDSLEREYREAKNQLSS